MVKGGSRNPDILVYRRKHKEVLSAVVSYLFFQSWTVSFLISYAFQAFHLTSLSSLCILLDFLRLWQKAICFFSNGLDSFNSPFMKLGFSVLNTVLCKDNSVQWSKKHFANMKGQTLPSFTPLDFGEVEDSAGWKSVSLFYANFVVPGYC